MLKTAVLILFAAFLPAFRAENWCNKTTCPAGEHVDCIDTSWHQDNCGKLTIIDMTPIAASIVSRHNQVRNRVAGGTLKASRMGTMRWSAPLAEFAERIVKYCHPYHGTCVNTLNFNFVGENVLDVGYRRDANRDSYDVMLELIDVWIQAQNKTTQADIRKFKESGWTRTQDYYWFCQMVRGFSTRIGCSAMRYDYQEDLYIMQLTCLYDMDNIVDYPVYDVGPTASKCKTGTNQNFPNLCSVNERFNVNQYWKEYE